MILSNLKKNYFLQLVDAKLAFIYDFANSSFE